MTDYKPPRRKKHRARLLSPTGYLVLLVAIVVLIGGGLCVRHLYKKAHEPLPASVQLDNQAMLPHALENERDL